MILPRVHGCSRQCASLVRKVHLGASQECSTSWRTFRIWLHCTERTRDPSDDGVFILSSFASKSSVEPVPVSRVLKSNSLTMQSYGCGHMRSLRASAPSILPYFVLHSDSLIDHDSTLSTLIFDRRCVGKPASLCRGGWHDRSRV